LTDIAASNEKGGFGRPRRPEKSSSRERERERERDELGAVQRPGRLWVQ
jgi:hypothetical protein